MQYLQSKAFHLMRIITVAPFMLISFLSLNACSLFNKSEEASIYQSNVKYTPPLTIPEHLNKDKVENYYPLPPLAQSTPMTKVSIVPPGSLLEKEISTSKKK